MRNGTALFLRGTALAFCAMLLFFWGCAPRQAPDPKPNVLLVTVGALRADRIRIYGAGAAETPVLDRLARQGTRFTQAYTVSDMANPSCWSILTSMYVKRHSPYHFPAKCPAELLPALFKKSGYATGACVGTFLLDKEVFPPADSFDSYASPGTLHRTLMAGEVNLAAASFLETHRTEPWFLWVHYNDLNEPYDSPEAYGSSKALSYDREVAYVDHSLGTLLSTLDELGLRSRTLIALTADHGQAVEEHLLSNEHQGLYEEIVHVPLIISYPGVIPADRVATQLVLTLDIMPTLAALLSLKTEIQGDGISLIPLLQGRDTPLHFAIYAEGYLQRCAMVRQGSWKLITYYDLMQGKSRRRNSFYRSPGATELFNLEQDPNETESSASTNTQKFTQLKDLLDEWYKDSPYIPTGKAPLENSGLLIRTRLLGY
ncbi:MAG: sulfatase [Candidatus Eremiobacteraeota bacterium]|nr:sulfatase [Candidatus Eremiobacteraeota bacterium]